MLDRIGGRYRSMTTSRVSFQKKHWFDSDITLRWLRDLLVEFPAPAIIGLIWDRAPCHMSKAVDQFLEEHADRLWESFRVCVLPVAARGSCEPQPLSCRGQGRSAQ